MIKIINTSGQIDDLFDKGAFSRDKWREYINLIYEDSSHLFEDEGYGWYHRGGLH